MIVDVRNDGRSPRGIRSISGRYVVVMPGQSKPINLDDVGIKLAKQAKCSVFGEPTPKQNVIPNVVFTDTVESLRSEAESLGIKIDKRWKEKRLKDEINAVRNTNSNRA